MGTTELVYVDGQPDHVAFTADETVTEVTYTIDGDKIILNGTEGSSATGQDLGRWNAYGLACCWADDGSFGGCLEWDTELTRTETSVIPTVIYSQPEGEMVTYNRAGMSIFTGYFGVQSSPFADKMNLVYGTDGKVYIQNPLWWNKSYNTWVWGDFDPETGTFIRTPMVIICMSTSSMTSMQFTTRLMVITSICSVVRVIPMLDSPTSTTPLV